jgi:hypothetical protein
VVLLSQTPPFHHTSAAEVAHTHHAATGTACDLHNGTTQYLGLRGGHECSDYYVRSGTTHTPAHAL